MAAISNCPISIDLLPEFGWSIKDQPVYGPGSVFQGHVKVNSIQDIQNIRIAFYALETVPPFDVNFGIMRTAKHTLFSVQLTLWDSTKDTTLDSTLPFTIQMPMIQFPPTMKHSIYRCDFQLIAIVNTSAGMIKTERSIICMPYVETRLLKIPRVLTMTRSPLSAQLKLSAVEFVPGDNIPLSLYVGHVGNSKRSAHVVVQLKLIQTVSTPVFDDIPDSQLTVASALHKLLLIPTGSTGSFCDGDFTLALPDDLTPSCNYGKLARISYRLCVSVEHKGPMGGIWNYVAAFEDIPITVGTLGYGIKLSNAFSTYDQYSVRNNRLVDMPIPTFMKTIEYEDALPLYDSARLPDYDSAPILC